MHIHGSPMNLNGANLHSAAAAEKAASAQRAADVRKKLMSGGPGMADGLNPEAVAMIGRWSGGASGGGSQGERQQEPAERPTRAYAAEGEEASHPVSVWA